MKKRTTMCSEQNDYWLDFVDEEGVVQAAFSTTKEARVKYNRLRELWRGGASVGEIRRRIAIICKG